MAQKFSSIDNDLFISDEEMKMIFKFHRRFNFIRNNYPTHLTQRIMEERSACMAEELKEFVDAARGQDMAGMLDALIDLVYFAKGTALMLGLGKLWAEAFEDVHRANMAKARGVGPRGHSDDVIKPEGWQGPKTESILKQWAYRRDLFVDPLTGRVEDQLCDDVDRPR